MQNNFDYTGIKLESYKDLKEKAKNYRKSIDKKGLLFDSLLAIIPIIFTCGSFLVLPYVNLLSYVALYFVLPMYYAVYMRVTKHITGYGKANYTFVDGYKDFFSMAGGALPSIAGVFIPYLIYSLFYGVFISTSFGPLMNHMYPFAFDKIQAIIDQNPNVAFDVYSDQVFAALQSDIVYYGQVYSILSSLSLFIPLIVGLFLFVKGAEEHFASIFAIPDLHNNVPGARVRAIGKKIILATHPTYVNQIRLFNMWTILLVGIVSYGLSTYALTFIFTQYYQLTSVIPLIVSFVSMMAVLPFYLTRSFSYILAGMSSFSKVVLNNKAYVIVNQFNFPTYRHTEDYKGLALFFNESLDKPKYQDNMNNIFETFFKNANMNSQNNPFYNSQNDNSENINSKEGENNSNVIDTEATEVVNVEEDTSIVDFDN